MPARVRAQDAAGPADSASLGAGRARGDTDAAVGSEFGWFGRGLVAGALTGPFGTWWVVKRAGRSRVAVPTDRQAALAGGDSAYASAFREGYAQRRQRERREYAFMGGALGTTAFAFVILRFTRVLGKTSTPGGEAPPPGFVLSFTY